MIKEYNSAEKFGAENRQPKSNSVLRGPPGAPIRGAPGGAPRLPLSSSVTHSLNLKKHLELGQEDKRLNEPRQSNNADTG